MRAPPRSPSKHGAHNAASGFTGTIKALIYYRMMLSTSLVAAPSYGEPAAGTSAFARFRRTGRGLALI